ncbi:MAG: HAMP domain-containing histidine kinase, partial [Actinobacteria bacterium]|nr:HAMP domain-containing histidine kinase [Actinomycetota bacterium]
TSDRRYAMAILRDVSERKKKDRELAALNESLREFLAIAAHDMRTPLSVIQGMTALLMKSETTDPEKRARMLDAVYRQSERMARLIEDLLTVSRIDAAAVEVQPERVSIAPIARQLVGTLGASELVTISGPEDLAAEVDRSHLERMLQNYVTNALEHGGPPVKLDISEDAEDVVVSVVDSGDGVTAEVADRLFHKFARSAASRERGGTGLGLSIVRGLARANGGDAWYEESDSPGTCFRIRFPKAS